MKRSNGLRRNDENDFLFRDEEEDDELNKIMNNDESSRRLFQAFTKNLSRGRTTTTTNSDNKSKRSTSRKRVQKAISNMLSINKAKHTTLPEQNTTRTSVNKRGGAGRSTTSEAISSTTRSSKIKEYLEQKQHQHHPEDEGATVKEVL